METTVSGEPLPWGPGKWARDCPMPETRPGACHVRAGPGTKDRIVVRGLRRRRDGEPKREPGLLSSWPVAGVAEGGPRGKERNQSGGEKGANQN